MVQTEFKKIILSLFFVLLLLSSVSAQTVDTLWFTQARDYSSVSPEVIALEKQFLMGDISRKTDVIRQSERLREEAAPLYTDALNFVTDYTDLLKEEAGMEQLAVAVIGKSPYAMGDVSIQLLSIFSRWNAPEIQAAVLDSFPQLGFYGYESAAIFNSFAQELLQVPSDQWDLPMMKRTLTALSCIDDSSSFDVFFAYYALPDTEETAEVRQCARKALLSSRDEHLAWFRTMIESGNSQYQRTALQFIIENNEFTDFFRAEMAEKALQNAIFTAEESDEFTDDDVALQLLSLNELHRLSWTRSANLVQRLFPIAVGEYEEGFITDEDFISVITSVQELATLRAGVLLSDFLKTLNTQAEAGDFCSESLVLAVIQSLGALGDKIAFDSLLYVSYLPYSEQVIEASREALARLKW